MNTTINQYRSYQIVAIILSVIIASFIIASIPTDTLIAWIGVDNAWFVMFVLGIMSGISTFVIIPYQLVLMSFASGGINPIVLAVSTAFGIMIGNSILFFFGRKIKKMFNTHQMKHMESFTQFFTQHPKYIIPFLFLYGMLSPFSNSLVILLFSMLNYSYTTIIVPISIGNIVYHIGLVYIGIYSYETIVGMFG